MKPTTPTEPPIKTYKVAWVPDFKRLLTNIFKPMKTNQHNTFNLENANAQDFHRMIQSNDLPAILNASQRERVKQLYEQGRSWDAISIIRTAIANSNKPKKTLL